MLKQTYKSLQEAKPGIRIREAANILGVSELELLETSLGQSVTRLSGDWKELLRSLAPLGKVMALTRNEYAVHERKGIYQNVSFIGEGQMGVAVNPDIDLRFFMDQWAYGYAVAVPKGNRVLKGFQFFDGHGRAVHKIYLTPSSDEKAFEQLLRAYRAPDQDSTIKPLPSPVKEKALADELGFAEKAAFQKDWLGLEDTHDFFPMLRKHAVSRLQALHHAPVGMAIEVGTTAVRAAMLQAAEREVPVMVFVNSPGCIQIHTGEVKRLVDMGNWFNIMDPDFNLHLNLEGVAQSWIVRKPTKDGIVTALELFDAAGSLIAYFFGARKPGKPELGAWREILGSLRPLSELVTNG